MKPLVALLVLQLSSGGLAQILGAIPKIDNMPCVKEGYGYQDPNVKHVNGAYLPNAGACHQSCALFPNCYAFTWYKSSKECWFYGKGLELQEVPGAVGGPWECPTTTAGSDVAAASATTTAAVDRSPEGAAAASTDVVPSSAPGPAPSAAAEPEQATTTASDDALAASTSAAAADAAPELLDVDGPASATGPPVEEEGPPVPAPSAGAPTDTELGSNGTLAPAADPLAAPVETREGLPPSSAPSAGADIIPAVADEMPVAMPESSTLAPPSQTNSTGLVGVYDKEEEPGSSRLMIGLVVAMFAVLGLVCFGCLMRALNADDGEDSEQEEQDDEKGRRGRRKGKKTRAVEPAYGHVDVTDTHQDGEEVVDSARMFDNEQAVPPDYGELFSERSSLRRFQPPLAAGASLETSSLSTGSFTSWPQAPTRGLMPPPLLSPLMQPPQLLSPLQAAPTPFTLSAPWHSASTSSLGPPVLYSNSPATSFVPLQGPPSPYQAQARQGPPSPFPVQALPTSFVAMVPPSPNVAPRFPTDALFDMLDTNRDGVLSRSEVAYLFP